MNKLHFFIPILALLLSACGPVTAIPTASSTEIFTPVPTTVPSPTNIAVPGVGNTWISSKEGMTMLYIPEGEFSMGGVDLYSSDAEKPVHMIYLDAYWMDQTEITNDMFAKFVDDTEYTTDAERHGYSYVFQNGLWEKVEGADWFHPRGPNTGISAIRAHPVIHISWNDAKAYCEWRGDGISLPTEAEWEKAAGWDAANKRKRTYPWGDTFDGSLLNFCDTNCILTQADKAFNDGYGFTAPVGSYPDGASFYGLLDMAGNVWEWVDDWFDRYPGNTGNNDNYGTNFRGLRGGSWDAHNIVTRTSFRGLNGPGLTSDNFGFRCARSVE